MKTHIKRLMNPDYIGAYALPPGEDLVVTIKEVRQQTVTGNGGKKEEKAVVHLERPYKPLILNATNRDTIIKLYGPFIEDWTGKKITLFASVTSVAGEKTECVRVRPAVPGDAKPKPISDDRFTAALGQISLGKFSVAELLKKYDLTEEQQARMPKQIEAPTNDDAQVNS